MFSSDHFFTDSHNRNPDTTPDTPLYKMIREKVSSSQLHAVADYIIDLGCVEEFCRVFVESLPLEQDFFCIEGEVFQNETIYEALITVLKAKGIVIWDMQRA